MSCTVIALPYAIFMIVSSVAASIVAEASEKNNNSIGELDTTFNQEISCEDIERITEEHFIEKNIETVFMDKNLLIKTLTEHGINNVQESLSGEIVGSIDGYKFCFTKPSEDKPYSLKISAKQSENIDEKVEDLNSEYALNVQEDTYLSVVENLKNNNMEIESEEVMDDNTIVLTVNLE